MSIPRDASLRSMSYAGLLWMSVGVRMFVLYVTLNLFQGLNLKLNSEISRSWNEFRMTLKEKFQKQARVFNFYCAHPERLE